MARLFGGFRRALRKRLWKPNGPSPLATARTRTLYNLYSTWLNQRQPLWWLLATLEAGLGS